MSTPTAICSMVSLSFSQQNKVFKKGTIKEITKLSFFFQMSEYLPKINWKLYSLQ